jgi:hypothetical protein
MHPHVACGGSPQEGEADHGFTTPQVLEPQGITAPAREWIDRMAAEEAENETQSRALGLIGV